MILCQQVAVRNEPPRERLAIGLHSEQNVNRGEVPCVIFGT